MSLNSVLMEDGDAGEPMIAQDNATSVRSTTRQREKCHLVARVLIIGTTAIVITFVLLIVFERKPTHHALYISALVLVAINLIITATNVFSHLIHWNVPVIQGYYLAIWGFVPVMSITSALALRYDEASAYFETIKKLYQAWFTIYPFYWLIITLVGGEERAIEVNATKDPSLGAHAKFIVCLLWCGKSWEMGEEYVKKCKYGIYQLIVVSSINGLLVLALAPFMSTTNVDFDGTNFSTFMSTATTLCTFRAMYSNNKLQSAFTEELTSPKDWRPNLKFKSLQIVFAISGIQNMVIGLLVTAGVFGSGSGGWDSTHIGAAVNNYALIIESLILAFVFMFSFTYMDTLDVEDTFTPQTEIVDESKEDDLQEVLISD